MKTDQEFLHLWESSIPGIELFSARLFCHQFGKHFHDAYTIGMNVGGQGSFLCQGENYVVYPGRFSLINPGAVHTGQAASSEGWAFRNIYLSVPLMERILTQMDWQGRGLPHFTAPTVCAASLQPLFHRLFQSLNTNTPASPLKLQSLLLKGLSDLILRYAEPHYSLRSPAAESRAVACVRDYLEAHYTEAISIETLAELVNLSPYYLIRSFHQQVGLPPHQYQRNCQLLQAKRSLHSPKPLADIAVEHGFYDQSHLNRVFKQAYGITPGHYRKQNLQRGRKGNFVQYRSL